MPPKAPVILEPSMSPPPPPSGSDAQDLLIIQDIMDTLDQIPPELTKVHSDLNELGAVLYATLLNLENKLNTLVDWIQDSTIGPAQRFQLLQDIAEEAARYKLGGDDKIRVAGGACDGIMAHQKHISNLLAASTLLQPAPPSPYTQSLTLSHIPTYSTTRRGQLQRAANSPFGGRGYASGSGVASSGVGGEREKDTPTKKKKSRVQQLGRDDDEVSSLGGEKKKAPVKKRRPANRAVSPADSLGSASAFTGKPVEPRTARQLAAAANKVRKAERDDDASDDSRDEPRKGGLAMQITPSQDSIMDRIGGLGLDVDGSREGSNLGGRSANATPTLGHSSVLGEKARSTRVRAGIKRSRADEDEDDESDGEEEDVKPAPKRNGGKKAGVAAAQAQAQDVEVFEGDGEFGPDGEVDSKVYCTCRQVSYGEMIGCDDDDCEIEWYHLSCLGLPKPPEGNWICPQCAERRKKQPRGKKPAKVKGRAK